jgi:hypothetical protein
MLLLVLILIKFNQITRKNGNKFPFQRATACNPSPRQWPAAISFDLILQIAIGKLSQINGL